MLSFFVTLTDSELGLLRELLLDARDNAEEDAREAGNSEIMCFAARMEDCDTLLVKFSEPRPQRVS